MPADTTATVTGTVRDLSSMNPDRYTVGVVYSTDRDAVTTPSATRAPGALAEDGATVNTVITGLQPGATYYYAQYVTLQSKYTQYGEIQAFVTSDAKVNTIDAADRADRANGLSIRPVRPRPVLGSLPFIPENILMGDLESNGNFRIDFYNEYSTTKDNPAIDLNDFVFKKNMVVTFTLSGINGNIKDGAASSWMAYIGLYAAGWWPSYWNQGNDWTTNEAIVNGDGTYRVVFDQNAEVNGVITFVIDIKGLMASLADASKLQCTIESIQLDRDPARQTIDVDNSKTVFMGKEGGTVDGRLEIFNSTATNIDPSVDFSYVAFPAGTMHIKYTVSGISGNLKAGAKNSYLSAISFADGSWDPSYWGGSIGDRPVTGDGTYEIAAPLTAEAEGAAVWCIEFYGLYQDLVDPSLVKVNIDKVTVPGF